MCQAPPDRVTAISSTAYAPPSASTGRRLRVLQVGKFYPPYRGGMETHLQQLCTELNGVADVEVVVSATSHFGARERVDGVDVTRAGTLFSIAGACISPTIWRRIRAADQQSIVHLHWPNPPAALAYLASGHTGPLVVTYHSDIVRQRVLGRAFEPVLRRLLDRCLVIIVSSAQYVDSSPVLRAYRDRCRVIPFGIALQPVLQADADAAQALRDRYGPRIVLGVGRLVGYKGFEYLIRAMPLVRGRLLLVGNGPLHAALEHEARRCGVADRVTFLGNVADVLPYLRAADVLALPSVTRAEAFGMVQLEAMACRTPVVNTSLDSGVPCVSIDGTTGLTVPPADAPALARAISAILDDPVRSAAYGRAARRRVEMEFNLDQMVRRTLDVYHEVGAFPR